MTLHTCRMLATLFLLVTCSVVSAFDAVLNRGAGVAVLFADGQFIRFNLGQWRGSDGYPKPVDSESWPGITEGPIDAAINWGNGKAYLFRGREYFRYDLSE
ncbi:MAG: hemopexin repeat-containing protein, partial [Gammaproteobacteria bacterium]